MAQSLANMLVHMVFSTKNRHAFLTDDTLRDELYSYMATVFKNSVDSPAILINGMPDHVHILFSMSRKFALMDVIKTVKIDSTKWLKRISESTKQFAWQSGYGAFSVSESNKVQVRTYIQNQQSHHATMTFQDEFRVLCRKNNVAFDENYVWD